MKPTLQQIMDQSRSLLGDDDLAGGAIFTNQVLQPHVSQATRELFRVLRGTEDPFVLTDAYYLLPTNTSTLDPATAGLLNFNIPEWVEMQIGPSIGIAISNVVVGTSGGNPVATVTTATPHGLTNGASCVVWGILGFDPFNSPNSLWTITSTGASTLTLNGCTATGTYVSGGFLAGITGNFTQMEPLDRIENVPAVSGNSPITAYAWEGGVFRFYPAPQPILLRIVFRTSNIVTTSSSGVIPIDDCQDYIATRAAGFAGASRGADQTARSLHEQAVGPTGQADGNGGLLRQLVQVDVRNMQRRQMRMRPFRERRNRPDYLLF